MFSQWCEGLISIGHHSLICRSDIYSNTFMFVLFIVSRRVFVWSFYYMAGRDYARFRYLLISFLIRMVLLIFFSSLSAAIIGWDLLGITSFLLVIFYNNRKRLGSGLITALTNRIGDCLFICLISISPSYLSVLMLLLIAMTKRAQFPFSSWLPAAIAAPTPVRALVHSSTLVTAGVYILIRFRHVNAGIEYVGILTIVLAGLRACSESDIKKVVALRTLSQLGVIIVSMGCKSYCFFHIISHAGFKALLFLCVGTCIHTFYGTQDFRRFNQVSSTATIFITVSILSLMGFLFTSGFYRKDTILENLYREGSLLTAAYLFGIALTSLYSVKILWIISKGSFTHNSSVCSASTRWMLAPIMVLGLLSTSLGSLIFNYCNAVYICIPTGEKSLLVCILLGAAVYAWPNWPSLFFMTQHNQKMANYPTEMTQQKNIDKGWLDTNVLPSLNLLPFIGIGLCMLILIL